MNSPVDRKSLVILHAALVFGCTTFMGVAGFLWYGGTVPLVPGTPILSFTGVALAAVLVPLSFPVFRTLLARGLAQAPEDLPAGIRTACIAQWAIVEVACFLNTLLFLFGADLLALGAAVFTWGVLIALAPTRERWDRWMTGV